MTLPHFDPVIKNIRMYRTDGTLIGPNDYVSPGTTVRVEAVLQNTNASAGSEQFPLHLKMLGATHATYPTVGLTTSDAVASSAGRAVTLTGTTETKVTFNATISGAAGAAASIGLQLVDDSFGGTYEAGAKLLNERPLVPGDGSGSGTAGKDYHYTRLPAANENGWNKEPVTVTFYPGDFDQMTLAPSEGASATLTGADPAWTRSEDTAGLSLSAQATNTATGAVSTQRAGTVKIDTSAPRLSADPALDVLTADDSADVTSGIWRLYRTGSSGAVASSARASAYKTFSLTSGNGASSQSVAAVPNGYYVAEDAAGNLSTPVKVGFTEPPSVERPGGSIVDPDDPNPPTPVGPPIGPDDKVPDPTLSEDDEGLRHATVEETVTETIDPAAPPFGGTLDAAKAKALMDYRYAVSSAAGVASVVDTLLDSAGDPLASLDTTVPGECTVRRVVTDTQGNTTTILLHYRTMRDSCPVVRPLEPIDPDDPDGPTEAGDPLAPTDPVTTDADGAQHTAVACEVTEATGPGSLDAAGAAALLVRHFAVESAAGADAALTVQSMKDAAGGALSSIDLSRPGDYLITYRAADEAGNTTEVRLTYHLVESQAPVVKPAPSPNDPDPAPLEPPVPPHIHPDGTHHALLYDALRVPTRDGAALTLGGARELMEDRYTFAAADGGPLGERELTLATADGEPVTSIDLSREGRYLIVYTVADGKGNTTTVNLSYEVFRDKTPVVRPLVPVDPADPTGATEPGEPLEPTGPVTEKPDGTQSATVECEVTEAVTHGLMDVVGARALLARHFDVSAAAGQGDVSVTVQSMANDAGNLLTVIDLSRQARYRITYLVRDDAGNETTVLMSYRLVASRVPGVVVYPDPSEVPGLTPGGDPLNPAPYPLYPPVPPQVAADGTQHGAVEDTMYVKVQADRSLALPDARSLMDRRYGFTAEGGGAVSEVSLSLADASGAAVDAIDLARPGSWHIAYKVRDEHGNTMTVNLRYVVVADAPAVTPTDPGSNGGSGDGPGSSGDGSGGGSDPLPPASVTVDPETGLTHAVIVDEVTVPTAADPLTVAAMGTFMDARYALVSALSDGDLNRGEPRLYDADGNEVQVIDRSEPGDWRAERVVADSAGDTVTIRLAYLVREGTITGGVSGDDGSNGAGNGDGSGSNGGDGSSGSAAADGSGQDGAGDGAGRWASRLRELPQTGGLLGPCPLHILFLLIMVLASAYSLMRLRQEAAARDERRRRNAEWEEFCRETL